MRGAGTEAQTGEWIAEHGETKPLGTGPEWLGATGKAGARPAADQAAPGHQGRQISRPGARLPLSMRGTAGCLFPRAVGKCRLGRASGSIPDATLERRHWLPRWSVGARGLDLDSGSGSWFEVRFRHALGRRHQRFAKRQVQVHRPWPVAETHRRRARAERAHHLERGRPLFGWSGVVELAHETAEQSGLIDGLIRPPAAQFRRAVGGQQDQRDLGLGRLDDGREPVRERAPGGTHQPHRAARGARQTEREKGGAALVQKRGEFQLGLALPRQDQRRGTRTGREHQVPHPARDQPIEQGQRPAQIPAALIRRFLHCATA